MKNTGKYLAYICCVFTVEWVMLNMAKKSPCKKAQKR